MLADLGLLYCALFWGLSFPAMKILLNVYPSCWLLFIRFLSGAFLVYIFFHGRINKFFKRDLKGGIIIGTLLSIALISQTIGMNYISGGRSAFLSAIYVLLVPLIIWAFKKIFPGYITLFAACLCVAGMFFLTSGDETFNLDLNLNIGDVLTITCACIFACQIIMINKFAKSCDPITLSFITFIMVALFRLIYSVILERKFFIDYASIHELIFTIVFVTFGCYMLQIISQKYAEPSHAVIIMSLESVFGLLGGIIFLNETINFKSGLGCALIFFSVLISELKGIAKK